MSISFWYKRSKSPNKCGDSAWPRPRWNVTHVLLPQSRHIWLDLLPCTVAVFPGVIWTEFRMVWDTVDASEIWQKTTWDVFRRPVVNNGINYQAQLVISTDFYNFHLPRSLQTFAQVTDPKGQPNWMFWWHFDTIHQKLNRTESQRTPK